MKKRTATLIITGIILLLAGSISYLVMRPSEETQTKPATSQPPASPPKKETEPERPRQTAQPGRYEDYNASVFANTTGRRWLFFHAPWCPQCRAIDSDIKADGVPQGITIFKVDYDSSQALRQKYGVTIQTTVVEVDAAGNEKQKFVAYDDPTFDAVLNALGR